MIIEVYKEKHRTYVVQDGKQYIFTKDRNMHDILRLCAKFISGNHKFDSVKHSRSLSTEDLIVVVGL